MPPCGSTSTCRADAERIPAHLGLHEGSEPTKSAEDVTDDLVELDLDPEPFLQGDDELDDGERVELRKVAVESRLRPEVIGLVLDVQRDHHDGLDVLENRLRDLW
jgi:hypothetical protein